MDLRSFSLEYIEIISEILELDEEVLRKTDRFNYSPNPDQYTWNYKTPRLLWDRLSELFDSFLNTIRNNNTLTLRNEAAFHFGYSDKPFETLKYAPLYTNHVIMQDLIYRMLDVRAKWAWNNPIKKHQIVPVAVELARWKPLIQAGRVSIIPSPQYWHEEISRHFRTLDKSQRVYAAPLYAAILFGCTPLTDSPSVCKQLSVLAKSSLGKDVADHLSDVSDNYRFDENFLAEKLSDRVNEYEVIDVLPRLLGTRGNKTVPELWYIKNATPEEVNSIAEDVEGFRSEIMDAIDQINDCSEKKQVDELIEKSSEEVHREYQKLQDIRKSQKNRFARNVTIQSIIGTAPVFVGLTYADLQTALLGGMGSLGTAAWSIKNEVDIYKQTNSSTILTVFDRFQLQSYNEY